MFRLLTIVFLVIAIPAQSASPPLPFGMTLSAKTIRLWNEVTKAYGKPIREEQPPDVSDSGRSVIADDGTPVVQLAADSHDEDHLVHELMHLKLFLEGFPIGAEWALGCDNKREFRLAEWSRMNLNEAIDHWIFYPQIRAMGMTPDQSYVNDLKKMVMSADAASIPARSLAVDYFRAKTMAGQQNLARSVREWCLAGHQAEAVKAGDAMFEILMKQRPASPDQAIETYVACANVLFEDAKGFKFLGWHNMPRGNVQVRLARMLMWSLTPCR